MHTLCGNASSHTIPHKIGRLIILGMLNPKNGKIILWQFCGAFYWLNFHKPATLDNIKTLECKCVSARGCNPHMIQFLSWKSIHLRQAFKFIKGVNINTWWFSYMHSKVLKISLRNQLQQQQSLVTEFNWIEAKNE